MITSAFTILIVVALILTIIEGVTGKVPLWIAVLLICIALLIGHVPVLR